MTLQTAVHDATAEPTPNYDTWLSSSFYEKSAFFENVLIHCKNEKLKNNPTDALYPRFYSVCIRWHDFWQEKNSYNDEDGVIRLYLVL
jgi:hypothetical protein